MIKLYFESEMDAMAYSAAEAEYRGCNMESSLYWYGWEKDVNGWYLEVEVAGQPTNEF